MLNSKPLGAMNVLGQLGQLIACLGVLFVGYPYPVINPSQCLVLQLSQPLGVGDGQHFGKLFCWKRFMSIQNHLLCNHKTCRKEIELVVRVDAQVTSFGWWVEKGILGIGGHALVTICLRGIETIVPTIRMLLVPFTGHLGLFLRNRRCLGASSHENNGSHVYSQWPH